MKMDPLCYARRIVSCDRGENVRRLQICCVDTGQEMPSLGHIKAIVVLACSREARLASSLYIYICDPKSQRWRSETRHVTFFSPWQVLVPICGSRSTTHRTEP